MPSAQAPLMSLPSRSSLAKHWELDQNCVFLNHGSFGATPVFIRNEQQKWQDLLEDEPVRFYEDLAMDYMANSRKALAMMLECDAEDLALIENATSGVNTVLRSLVFSKGDEILKHAQGMMAGDVKIAEGDVKNLKKSQEDMSKEFCAAKAKVAKKEQEIEDLKKKGGL